MIRRWWKNDEAHPLGHLRGAMERMLEGIADDGEWPLARWDGGRGTWMPAVDVRENDDEVTVEADLPGVNLKDISVQVNGDMLTIRAERKHESEEKTATLHRQECAYGLFERRLQLPAPVEREKVQATFKKGILRIALPKAPASKAKSCAVTIKEA